MDTVTLTIDGRQVSVEKGRSVLQAAIEHGFSVPYYCYHPGLQVDGSCRVCLVKIEKMAKLQTACSTPAADGMVVFTETPDVVQARAGVLEFLLINHPLDCPVCDKGGECPLQDFAYSFGPEESRQEFKRRTFDGDGVKADVDFGPTLMLNRNRCILCTRCIRFMREIDGDAQIGIAARGNDSQLATFNEEGVHSLLSGNLMDVCPVGAITTRDYRFKSRPWDNPDAVDTICTLCSKGCNTTAWIKAKPEWAKGARLVRITPRFAPDVNGYWMCDIGRFGYHWIESDQRLSSPLVREPAGHQQSTTWEAALGAVAERAAQESPQGLMFLLSAHASNEEIFLIQRLASSIAVTWTRSAKAQPAATRFPVPTTDAPNLNGARDLGLPVGAGNDGAADLTALRQAVETGGIRALYVFDPGPPDSLGDVSWIIAAREAGTLALLVVQSAVNSPLSRAADVVLPGSAWVEKDGTYTNDEGRVQASARVFAPPGEALDDREILVRVADALGRSLPYASPTDVRAAIAAQLPDHPAYANLTELSFARPVPARHWLQASNPSERWKWDFMFQEVNVQKWDGLTAALPQLGIIPLQPIQEPPPPDTDAGES
jgi:NADH-quinone oxidoreductase subunit G